jgi:O-antigen ligase
MSAPYYTHLHTEANFIDPHNIVLNFWVEVGLLGLIAFAWIMFVGFRVSWHGWRSASAGWRPYHLGVLLALVAVLVHGQVDVPYFKNDLSLQFWTLIGLTAAGLRWATAGADPVNVKPAGSAAEPRLLPSEERPRDVLAVPVGVVAEPGRLRLA